ncbi:MAG: type II toxin-antitoxin system ParD family antitoxin [Terracidiphilus sp.]|jgi:putative addiction module CopG family antidote
MPHRPVKLPPESHDFVLSRVESGRYENAGEVMRAALRALHREEKNSDAESLARSIAEGDVFRKLWEASASSLPETRSSSGNLVAQQ